MSSPKIETLFNKIRITLKQTTMDNTFLDIKTKFPTVQAFIEWANEQDFTPLKQACQGLVYCDLALGNRTIQHRISECNIRTKGVVLNPFRDFGEQERFYNWESVYGKVLAERLAKKYDATIMEAPYTDIEDDYILVFKTFEGCLTFMWDTAEMHQAMYAKWQELGDKIPLNELYKEAYQF